MIHPKPPSVYDETFKYTHSSKTDLRKTFARIRKEQKLAIQQEQAAKVRQIGKATK